MNSAVGKEVSVPQDIIFEIFSWLPFKHLMRFQCVCKFCNLIVSESDFVELHTYHCPGGETKFLLQGEGGVYYTAEQKKYGKCPESFLQIRRFNKLFDRAPAYSSRLNCVNDLFCVWEPLAERPAAMFNPGTREVRFLPVLNDFFPYNYSLGFEPEENKYKVLLSAKHVKEGQIKCWVLTLGIDKSWRETQSISPFTPHYHKPRVCISGVIYQFVIGDNEYAIAAFDVNSEKFEISSFWNLIDSVFHYELIEMKGKLAVIDYKKWLTGYIDLWILEQTPSKEWKRRVICFPSISKAKPYSGSISSSTSPDGEIVFFVNSNNSGALWLCYDVTTEIHRELDFKGLPKNTCIKGIYSYVERLGM